MYCEKCGEELKVGDAFCQACGTSIQDSDDGDKNMEAVVSSVSKESVQGVFKREHNGVATALMIIGGLVITIGTVIGFIILIYVLPQNGSQYYVGSAFSGLGVGLGVGTMVISVIFGLGFLGFGEIIQLLQDQKTIMLHKELNNQ